MTPADLRELADRCERATGPSRELDAEICLALQFGGENSEGAENVRLEEDYPEWLEFEIAGEACCNKLPALTASLDAAMSLVDGEPNEVLRNAIRRLSERFALHICFWPKDQSYAEWLARFVAAAALRARADHLQSEGNS